MNELKTSKIDIGIVAVFTTLSILLFNISVLNNTEILTVLKIVIVFLSGYSLLAMIFPGSNFSKVKFFLASALCSALIVFLLALILGVFLNVSNGTFINVLLIITNIFIAVAFIRRLKLSKKIEERYIVCETCRSYYLLKAGESLEDFEACHCGGQLKYAEERFLINYGSEVRDITSIDETNKTGISKFKLLISIFLIGL